MVRIGLEKMFDVYQQLLVDIIEASNGTNNESSLQAKTTKSWREVKEGDRITSYTCSVCDTWVSCILSANLDSHWWMKISGRDSDASRISNHPRFIGLRASITQCTPLQCALLKQRGHFHDHRLWLRSLDASF
jgi:hypothetical protein